MSDLWLVTWTAQNLYLHSSCSFLKLPPLPILAPFLKVLTFSSLNWQIPPIVLLPPFWSCLFSLFALNMGILQALALNSSCPFLELMHFLAISADHLTSDPFHMPPEILCPSQESWFWNKLNVVPTKNWPDYLLHEDLSLQMPQVSPGHNLHAVAPRTG